MSGRTISTFDPNVYPKKDGIPMNGHRTDEVHGEYVVTDAEGKVYPLEPHELEIVKAWAETSDGHPEPVGEWHQEDIAQALAAIDDGERALERAVEIADMVMLRDKAAAVGLFLVTQHMTEAAQKAKILQLRAERKAGTWLADNVADPNDVRWHDETGLPEGITKSQSARWQLEASLPQDRFDEWVDECLAHSWELSAGGLRRLADNHAGKHEMTQGERDQLALKRIFLRWWPEKSESGYDHAWETFLEMSALVAMKAAK